MSANMNATLAFRSVRRLEKRVVRKFTNRNFDMVR